MFSPISSKTENSAISLSSPNDCHLFYFVKCTLLQHVVSRNYSNDSITKPRSQKLLYLTTRRFVCANFEQKSDCLGKLKLIFAPL